MKTKNKLLENGIVIKKNNGQYWVWINGQTQRCDLRLTGSKHTAQNPKKGQGKKQAAPAADIVVGDHVCVAFTPDGRGQICDLVERSNRLARRAARPMPGRHASEQVIAANIDLLVAVMSLSQPEPRWNLLDRYLASAESLEIDAVICLTKVDAARNDNYQLDENTLQEIETYKKIGYRVLVTSAYTGEGLPELKQTLRDQVSVLLGKSGVGKSSILNSLLPGHDHQVSEVSQVTGKGRHTTTCAEMIACDFGGWLIDTPGTREFGLWDVDSDDMTWFFPEMRPYIGQCRFGLDCQHDEEPGCAVRQAVMNGHISPRRYFSMMKLKEEGYSQW